MIASLRAALDNQCEEWRRNIETLPRFVTVIEEDLFIVADRFPVDWGEAFLCEEVGRVIDSYKFHWFDALGGLRTSDAPLAPSSGPPAEGLVRP